MIERIEGIVTDIVRHNDKHNVVTLYTRQRGRMAFLVPVGKSKTGKMRNAMFSLLAVIGAEVNIKPGKELYNIRQPEPLRLWHSIYSHPIKSSLLFFLTEFCNRLLRQYPADQRLWDYLIQALEVLENIDGSKTANFHLAFLIRLLPLAGIEPPARTWEKDDRFDMLSGEMTAEPTAFSRRRQLLTEEESWKIPLLMRMNFRNMNRFRFRSDERQRVLNRLLSYYSIHLPISTDFKTLPVLHDLFS